MKNQKITNEEYNIYIDTLNNYNMKTSYHFLEWYNNFDLLPSILQFHRAVTVDKMKTFCKNKNQIVLKVEFHYLALYWNIKWKEVTLIFLFDEENKIMMQMPNMNIL